MSKSDHPVDQVRLTQDSGLVVESAPKIIEYFYQVRSNATHRAKEAPMDFELLHTATKLLLRAFRVALQAARQDAAWEGMERPSGR